MCGVGTRDPCTRLISVLVLLGFVLFILHVVSYEFWTAEVFQQEAEAWDDATWQRSYCTILSTGVSCINTKDSKDERDWNLCSQNISNMSTPASYDASAPAFSVWQRSICPGTFFCAKENEPCICVGQITYSRALFDGYRYHTPENSSYTLESNGSQHLCGVDQHGQILVDPAPNHKKFCWCTPKKIRQILQKHEQHRPLEQQRCANDADSEFVSESSRRLQATYSSRRRTYQYTPWALVLERKTKEISCAYEYGVPRPSTDLYETAGTHDIDGYGSDDHLKADLVARKWGSGTKRDCWIRDFSKDGVCAIALKPPHALTTRAARKSITARHHLILSIAAFLTLLLLGCSVVVAAREVTAGNLGKPSRPLLAAGE
ncbi:unnamed protein product [Durusdinium trenchii]|uniref:Uncharacterized protein n=2 Tax=Durusdinium trenchii TaxID=1381693 RepID=A0ABP0L137_9DINO